MKYATISIEGHKMGTDAEEASVNAVAREMAGARFDASTLLEFELIKGLRGRFYMPHHWDAYLAEYRRRARILHGEAMRWLMNENWLPTDPS